VPANAAPRSRKVSLGRLLKRSRAIAATASARNTDTVSRSMWMETLPTQGRRSSQGAAARQTSATAT
jgi:hypothetical protein